MSNILLKSLEFPLDLIRLHVDFVLYICAFGFFSHLYIYLYFFFVLLRYNLDWLENKFLVQIMNT